MLSCGWPTALGQARRDVLYYVALELPAVLEAVALLVGSTLLREYGLRNAILHPPHITLHPPFAAKRPRDALAGEFADACSGLPAPEEVELVDVTRFGDVPELAPSQVVMRFSTSWCVPAHRALESALRASSDAENPLPEALWPSEHRGTRYVPHVSLAVGDLPDAPELRVRLAERATQVALGALALTRFPGAFPPRRVHLVGYEAAWDSDPGRVLAGPEVVATSVIPRSAASESP